MLNAKVFCDATAPVRFPQSLNNAETWVFLEVGLDFFRKTHTNVVVSYVGEPFVTIHFVYFRETFIFDYLNSVVPVTMRLIVNADDLGYSAHRDEAIFDLFESGKVSSASLIVNGPTSVSAAQKAVSIGLPLGLHLNLTEGEPLTHNENLKEDGRMLYKLLFRHKAWLNLESFCRAVSGEVSAQLNRFHEITGNPVKHVDGHQHVHVAPNMPALLAPIFRAHGVLSVRIPEEWTEEYDWLDIPSKRHYGMRYIDALNARLVYLHAGFKLNDHIVGMGMSGHAFTRARLKNCLRDKVGIVELMIHPGKSCETVSHGLFTDSFDTDSGRAHEWAVLKAFDFSGPLVSWAGAFEPPIVPTP